MLKYNEVSREIIGGLNSVLAKWKGSLEMRSTGRMKGDNEEDEIREREGKRIDIVEKNV